MVSALEDRLYILVTGANGYAIALKTIGNEYTSLTFDTAVLASLPVAASLTNFLKPVRKPSP